MLGSFALAQGLTECASSGAGKESVTPECKAALMSRVEAECGSGGKEGVGESVIIVYSDAGCTEELGIDGFQQTRREFTDLPYMPAECVPDAGECFVLKEACRAAHASRFNHWATEYDGSANVAAIQITSWKEEVGGGEEEGGLHEHDH